MSRTTWHQRIRRLASWLRPARRERTRARLLKIESLDSRLTPAVNAFFIPSTGILSVSGDALNNTIAVSRNAAGQLLVNGGAVAINGGTATVANTTQIKIFGLGGDDQIAELQRLFDEESKATGLRQRYEAILNEVTGS